MGRQVDLLKTLPHVKRNLETREARRNVDTVRISKKFGEKYFDGPRAYGYGGYQYDGRWVPVAHDIIDHFDLKPGDKVLDIGCAKGFLVRDLRDALPGLTVFGLDISHYALVNSPADVKGRLCLGTADQLPFPDNAFTAALAVDSIHNLPRERAKTALTEIERVCDGRAFVRVDSYHNTEQKEVFEGWVLTAEFHDFPSGWLTLFSEAGYTGDYDWTIIQ